MPLFYNLRVDWVNIVSENLSHCLYYSCLIVWTLALLDVLLSVLCGNYLRAKIKLRKIDPIDCSSNSESNINDNPILLTNRLLILHIGMLDRYIYISWKRNVDCLVPQYNLSTALSTYVKERKYIFPRDII